MKALLIILSLALSFGFTPASNCSDGVVYANSEQTQSDKRFDTYTKINGVPKIKGGEKKLNNTVKDNLILSAAAKTQIFNLNYQFTITCEGELEDVKQIGNAQVDDWTNIVEVIESPKGQWKPAEVAGEPVNCVFFSKIFINGTLY